MKKTKSIVIILIAFLLVGISMEFILRSRDINKYVVPGTLIEVKGEDIHIFSVGEGEHTIILIPGLGTSSPYVDFQPLWSRLSKNNRVVVVERFGYGFSDLSKTDRNLENIISEMQEALKASGENPPFTLVGHSLGGTISMAYANAYSDEISNIVMLDAAVPKTYKEWKPPSQPLAVIMPFVRTTGLVRGLSYSGRIMEALRGHQNQYKEVPKEFWEIDRSIFIRKTMNANVKSEMQLFKDINEYNFNVPTLFITTPSLYEYIPGSKKAQDEYIKQASKVELLEFVGGHYIHHYYPNEVSEAIIEFINN